MMTGDGMLHNRSTARLAGAIVIFALLAGCGHARPKGSAQVASPAKKGTASKANGSVSPPSVLGTKSAQHIRWGVHTQPSSGGIEGAQAAIVDLESSVGRKFDFDRQFYRWDVDFPTPYDRWSAEQGRMMVISWSAIMQAGGPVLWSDIAAGRYDDTFIKPRAKAIAAFGRPIFFAFDHEPEARIKTNGTPAEFVAAWRHIVDVFRAQHVTNVTWVWIVIDYSFWTGAVKSYFPGDQYIDWIGVDGYNWFTCRSDNIAPWRSWTAIFDPARVFAAQHPSKPVMVAELGSVEDPAVPGRKASWLTDATLTLKRTSWSQFRGLIYYNKRDRWDPAGRDCDWRVTTSPIALQAFSSMGADPYF